MPRSTELSVGSLHLYRYLIAEADLISVIYLELFIDIWIDWQILDNLQIYIVLDQSLLSRTLICSRKSIPALHNT